jgi:hypothetical protein
MSIENRLVGKWKATTDGEKLFHFLVKNVGEFTELEHIHRKEVYDVVRGREFMHFVEGAVVLHCFGRLLQASKWFRREFNDDPVQIVTSIYQPIYFQLTFSSLITP